MAEYRKKAVVINAHQYVGNNSQEVMDMLGMKHPDHVHFTETGGMLIQTMEGEHIASVDDWIIKGVKGEFYPCKPDIFAMTYDATSTPSAESAPSIVHVCPIKDIVCGDNPSNWCDECPLIPKIDGIDRMPATPPRVVVTDECPAPSCDECPERGACTAEENLREAEDRPPATPPSESATIPEARVIELAATESLAQWSYTEQKWQCHPKLLRFAALIAREATGGKHA